MYMYPVDTSVALFLHWSYFIHPYSHPRMYIHICGHPHMQLWLHRGGTKCCCFRWVQLLQPTYVMLRDCILWAPLVGKCVVYLCTLILHTYMSNCYDEELHIYVHSHLYVIYPNLMTGLTQSRPLCTCARRDRCIYTNSQKRWSHKHLT